MGEMAKQILFSPSMVKAILGGRKTVTRRVMKPQPEGNAELLRYDCGMPVCSDGTTSAPPPYKKGCILWVREKWGRYLDLSSGTPTWRYAYFADGKERVPVYVDENGRELTIPVGWRPSIHMPKDACRFFLRVTGVQVEQLQDITDKEAQAEGVSYDLALECGYEKWRPSYYDPDSGGEPDWKEAFHCLWDRLLKPADLAEYGWDANPWVWRIEFQRCEKPDRWPGGGD